MAGPLYPITAWVVGHRPPAESFQSLTLFSVSQGSAMALQRLSKKNSGAQLDLFDEAEVLLETAQQGPASFVREVRIQTRLTGIGRTYESLHYASQTAQLVARNPVDESSRAALYELLRQAFTAFGESDRPAVVYLKTLYRFCRDEGYPLKQAWAPALTPSDRADLAAVLNQPLAEQSIEPATVARLLRGMEAYLRQETPILLD